MNWKPVLILSLAANLVLTVHVVRREMVTDQPVEGNSAAEAQRDSADREKTPATDPFRQPATSTPATRTFSWESVESPDYREYIANLRAIGCPEETIRDIIVADVGKLYTAKKRELRSEPKKFEYWKAGNPWMGQVDGDDLAKTRALEEEKLSVLRQLGIEPDAKMQMASLTDPMDAMGTLFGFLPGEKQVSVMKIMQDMQSQIADAAGEGGFDAEAMLQAQKKMEAAIREVLSPEEFRDYELRMSMTANAMRSQLAGWDPDEPEFLKVYELRKAFDDEFSMLGRGNETEAEQQQRQDAEQQLNEAIKQTLGDEQYEAYTRAKDWNFQQIYRAARRADLGTTEAVQVYDMRRVAESEARQVRANQDLTAEQRATALEGIQTETESSIRQVLGETGWDQYNRGYNTTWLRNLAPAAPTPQAGQ